MKYLYIFILILGLTTRGSPNNLSRECTTFGMESLSQEKMEKVSFYLYKKATIYADKHNREKAFENYKQNLLNIRLLKSCLNFKDSYFIKSFIELEIGKLYENSNPSSALVYYKKIMQIENNSIDSTNPSIKFNIKKSRYILLQEAYHRTGQIYLVHGKDKKALKYLNKGLEIIDFSFISSPKEYRKIAFLYNDIGIIYGNYQESSKSLIYMNKSLSFALKANDKKLLMYIYNNISINSKDNKSSIKILKDTINRLELDKSMKWIDKKDIYFMLNYNLTLAYLMKEEPSKAMKIQNKLLSFLETLPKNKENLLKLAFLLSTQADIFYIQHKYSDSILQIKKNLKISNLLKT